MKKRRVLLIVLVGLLVFALAGWGTYLFLTRAQGTPQAVEVEQAVLPSSVDGAALVGIGEATHGTREFYTAKRVLTEKLITEHGYRTVAIEGDYGGSRVADAYVRQGTGSAREAVAAIGFRVYDNQDMVDFLEMLRAHNANLPPEQQVAFYGVDMQRVDASKQQLESYLRPVDPALADQVAQATADLTDDTLPPSTDAAKAAQPNVDAALAAMTEREPALTAATTPDDYHLALQNLRAISQYTEVSAAPPTRYQPLRDERMATNAEWVVDREGARGGVVLIGHNGHVSRVPTGAGDTWSGVLLAEKYGDRYVAIGTDLHGGDISAGSTGDASFTVRQNYRGIFDGTRVGYVDFATLSPENRALMDEPEKMATLGAAWSGWMRFVPFTYTIEVVPTDAFDALVYVQQSTPTEELPE